MKTDKKLLNELIENSGITICGQCDQTQVRFKSDFLINFSFKGKSTSEKQSKGLFRRTWLKKASKINHVLSEAQYTLMKTVRENFQNSLHLLCLISKPSMLPNKPCCHLYPCCSILGSTWSFMTRLQWDYRIMTRTSRQARAFLLKCGETHLAACSKHREEIKQGLMQGQNSAFYSCAGVLYLCYSYSGRNPQFLDKALFWVLWIILAWWKHS